MTPGYRPEVRPCPVRQSPPSDALRCSDWRCCSSVSCSPANTRARHADLLRVIPAVPPVRSGAARGVYLGARPVRERATTPTSRPDRCRCRSDRQTSRGDSRRSASSGLAQRSLPRRDQAPDSADAVGWVVLNIGLRASSAAAVTSWTRPRSMAAASRGSGRFVVTSLAAQVLATGRSCLPAAPRASARRPLRSPCMTCDRHVLPCVVRAVVLRSWCKGPCQEWRARRKTPSRRVAGRIACRTTPSRRQSACDMI